MFRGDQLPRKSWTCAGKNKVQQVSMVVFVATEALNASSTECQSPPLSIILEAFDIHELPLHFLRSEIFTLRKPKDQECQRTSNSRLNVIINESSRIIQAQISPVQCTNDHLQYGFVNNFGVLFQQWLFRNQWWKYPSIDTKICIHRLHKSIWPIRPSKILLEVLKRRGSNGKCLNAIRSLYVEQITAIRDPDEKMIWLDCDVGQEIVLSAVVFST